jgi:predicted NBD/HSP70 family sugar kinase
MVAPAVPAATNGARQRTLRDVNLGVVLRTVLASPDPVLRTSVAIATGLTRATVSRLVDELIEGGLVDQLTPLPARGRGRPGTPLVPGGRVVALGLQVNPDYLAVRVVDLRGRVLDEHRVTEDLVGSNARQTLRRLGRHVGRVRGRLPPGLWIAGAGLALPGIVSVETGRVLSAPNLGWSNVDAAAMLDQRALGDLKLHVGNEADMAARTVAESAPGRPGSISDFVYVSGEIGIGGAAVIGGRVFRGRHGWAGEIGHVTVDPLGPACRCGSTGCLEQYAGRRAMLRAAGLPDDAPMELLVQRADVGDASALASVDSAARSLGVALSSVLNVLDIPTVVLGGHLAMAAPLLRPVLEEQLRRRVISAPWLHPTVEVATDDAAPGATGAAFTVLDSVVHRPDRWLDRLAHGPSAQH